LEWDWSGAEASFIQALSLGTHAPTYRQYAIYLTALERFDEAWIYLQYAQQIDPFSYRQKVACAKFFFLSRRYDEGLDYIATPVADAALPLEVRLYQALTYIKLGRHDDAKNMAQSLFRSVGAEPTLRACLAEIFALSGEKSLADKATAEFNLLSPTAPISKFRQALLSIASGNSQAALFLLSEAYADKEAEMPWLAVDPRFDSIHETTQCSEMIRDVRLEISS
jgi:tetratricopeptide (TPR) repeat protein